MERFGFLKKFIKNNSSGNRESKHEFYRVQEDDIIEAERRMGKKFPIELKKFYREIGYGFLCLEDNSRTDRIMHPQDVADFIQGEDIYEFFDRDDYKDYELVFVDISDGEFISLDLRDDGEISSVLYLGSKIAESIEDFIRKMEDETDYYCK